MIYQGRRFAAALFCFSALNSAEMNRSEFDGEMFVVVNPSTTLRVVPLPVTAAEAAVIPSGLGLL